MHFFRTLKAFRANPFVSTPAAVLKHSYWQVRKTIGPFPLVLERDGIRLMIHRETKNGAGGLFFSGGFWDPNNMRLVRELCSSGMVPNLVDVGANIGLYSMIAGQHLPVYSFEPHPFTYGAFLENRRLNGVEAQVHALQAALGDESGSVSFSDDPGSSINHVQVSPDETGPFLDVEILRGDDWASREGVRPGLVKIDVEGHEDSVLRGFGSLLAEVPALLIEVRDLDSTAGIVKGAGHLGPWQYLHGVKRFVDHKMHGEDWIFLHPEFAERLRQAGYELPV